jgi:hypothetical protein
MTSQHTPGPWSRNIKPATKYPTLFAGRNTHICTVSVSGLPPETVEANLLLIRAAPETLDALKGLLWAVTGFGDFEAQYPEEYAKARAAIARATRD